MKRALVVGAFALLLAACASQEQQVASAGESQAAPAAKAKTTRKCVRDRSTGSHIPSCKSSAIAVDADAVGDMVRDGAKNPGSAQ